MRLHATGLQTLAKLIENDINNVPIGFSYGRDADNTPLLNLINPNLLKIGRLHSRALDGPVRFPTGPKDLMVKVEQTYDAFFKIWNATMVPKLIPQPKWFKDSPELKPGDIVYFQKTQNELSSGSGALHYQEGLCQILQLQGEQAKVHRQARAKLLALMTATLCTTWPRWRS